MFNKIGFWPKTVLEISERSVLVVLMGKSVSLERAISQSDETI